MKDGNQIGSISVLYIQPTIPIYIYMFGSMYVCMHKCKSSFFYVYGTGLWSIIIVLPMIIYQRVKA